MESGKHFELPHYFEENTGRDRKKIPVRPGWNEFFLQLAEVYSTRGSCLRRQYGAVIVDQSRFLVSTGYCGAPQGVDNCIEVGRCHRDEKGIPAGQRYEECVSMHAEDNAIMTAGDKSRLAGTTLYLAGWDVQKQERIFTPPCINCAKKIIQVGIEIIILRAPENGMRLIPVEQLKEKLNRRDFNYPYELGSLVEG